jgi:uncharacterized protein with GYD domain
METFVMLTRVPTESLHQPRSFQTLERHFMEQVRKDCPGVKWVADYAVAGPFDYLDVFTAPDVRTAMRVSMLVRLYGRSHSEIWPAVAWADFKKMAGELPERRALELPEAA